LNLNQTKDNKNCLKSTYCRPLKQYKTTSAKRKIPVVPEKILDAPGILDDLYLNLLDWSTGNKLAVGLGPSVYLWDATVGNVEELCSFDDDDPIASVSWSLDGTHLAVSNFVGETHLFDVSTSQIVRTISSHNVRIGALSWNERVMSSGSENGSIHNHDVRIAHSKVSEYNGHSSDVCGLKWSFDGSQLASGGNDNFVNIWDIRTSSARFSNNEHTASVKALAWCQWQSNLLASGGGANDEKIVFWNTSTGTKDSVIHTGSQVTQLVFSKSYREILSSHGSSQNSLTLWKYPSLQKVCDIPQAHQSSILHLAISPDGQTVCSGAGDESLKFWKLFNIDTKKRVKGIGSVEVQKGKSPDFGMLNIR
jgi:cell division cycle protein 20 (cofactor of APC complex)